MVFETSNKYRPLHAQPAKLSLGHAVTRYRGGPDREADHANADGSLDQPWMIYYSANWQLCEERIADDSACADDATVGSLVRDVVNEHTNWFCRA
ncbi:MAG: hypothetical protein IIA64_03305 [Planctomycetes bacterium]|nr:hypothetical protein [Planctomycetota bacterium]